MSRDIDTFSPPVVCLCGSTKFKRQFEEAAERETLAGRIVVSVGFFAHQLTDEERREKLTPEVKARLDDLHLRKIDLADEVLVLNVGGYVGASTRREAWYALRKGKVLRWWEPPNYHEAGVAGWFAGWPEWQAAGAAAAQ